MWTDQKSIDFFTNEVILVKANTDKQDSLLARKYHIKLLPTLLLTEPDGTEIDRIIGVFEVDPILQTIRDYEHGIGTLADLLNKFDSTQDRSMANEIGNKYDSRGLPEKADNWYAKIVELGDPTDSLSGDALMSRAGLSRNAHEWDKALDAYMAIEKDFPGTEYAQDCEIYRAIIYRDSGDTAKAVAQFEKYVKMFPESPDLKYAQKQIDKLTEDLGQEEN